MSGIELTGGCLCGRVRYRAEGPPGVHWCHCGMCRRATGGAAAVLAWVAAAGLRWTGEAEPAQRRSSPLARRGFCPACGTPMTLVYNEGSEAGKVALYAGTLDEPERWPPRHHYGVEGRLPWMDAGKGLPERETEERW
jgi:hypothetical protein